MPIEPPVMNPVAPNLGPDTTKLNPENKEVTTNIPASEHPGNILMSQAVSPLNDTNGQTVPEKLVNKVIPAIKSNNQKDLAEIITQHNKETENHHINEKTNWEGVIMSLLGGPNSSIGQAWRYFNGGPKYDELAVDPNNKKYAVTYNMNGKVGQAYEYDPTKENGRGRQLTLQEYNTIPLITNKDSLDSMTSQWKGQSYFADKKNITNSDLVLGTQKDAYAAKSLANNSISSNQEYRDLLSKTVLRRPVFDATGKPVIDPKTGQQLVKNIPVGDFINSLSPQEKADLATYKSRLFQQGQTAGSSASGGVNVNANTNQQGTNGATVGGGLSGTGVSPLGVSGGLSESQTQGTNAGASGRIENANTSGTSASAQSTTDPRALMMGMLLKATGNDTQATNNLMRIMYLHNQLLDLDNKTPENFRNIPGFNRVAPDDIFTSGHNNLIQNSIAREENAHHALGYANRVYVSAKTNPDNIANLDLNQVQQDYQNSKMFKAIQDTYDYLKRDSQGEKMPKIPEGTLRVNPRTHRLERLINGVWGEEK